MCNVNHLIEETLSFFSVTGNYKLLYLRILKNLLNLSQTFQHLQAHNVLSSANRGADVVLAGDLSLCHYVLSISIHGQPQRHLVGE